jgi:ketosteroid isomerase-like protein
MIRFLSVAALTAITRACHSVPVASSMRNESDHRAVRAVIDEWRDAVAAGDSRRLLAVVSNDLEVIPPGQGALTGSAAHQFFQSLFDQFTIQPKPFTDEEIVVSGDWAFQRYTYELTLTPKAGGASVTERGHGIHIFRRSADGSWSLVKDIFNSVPTKR